MKTFYCFSGTGALFPISFGAGLYFRENIYPKPRYWGGASGGGLASLANALDMPKGEFVDLAASVMNPKKIRRLWPWEWFRHAGLHSTSGIADAVEKVFGGDLGELRKKANWGCSVDFEDYLGGSTVTTSKNPTLKVKEVVVAGLSVHYFFEPMMVTGVGYGRDGGSQANMPSNMFDDEAERVVKVRLDTGPQDVVRNLNDSVKLDMSAVESSAKALRVVTAGTQTNLPSKTLTIKIPKWAGASFDMSRDRETIERMVSYGWQQAAMWSGEIIVA